MVYAIDAHIVTHHYDEHGQLVGGQERYPHSSSCLGPKGWIAQVYTFGEQCELLIRQADSCRDVVTADGGT